MKKTVLLLCLTIFINTSLRAQSSSCYVVTGVPYVWDSLTAPVNLTLADDVFSSVINIGFPFCFFGNYYSQVVIGSNGVLSFNINLAGVFCPWVISQPLPVGAPANIRNAILFPWHELYPPVGGTIKYQTLGVAPYRKFVVQFQNVGMYSCTTTLFSGEVVLYESTNEIETHILNKAVCVGFNGGKAIHGLQDITGTIAVLVPGRNSPNQWTASNEGVRFAPVCLCPNEAGENVISGKVYRDENFNCNYETTDFVLSNSYVRLDPGPLYYSTDALGDYVMHVDTGNFTVTQIVPTYYTQLCPSSSYSVSFNSSPLTYPNADFADSVRHCHDVSVGISSSWQRVCRANILYIQCCNHSAIAANNVILTVTLSDSTFLVSPLNYIANPSPNVYQYALGNLAPNQCVNFNVSDSVDCALPLGRMLCFSASVTADSLDCNTANNADDDCRPVVNSFDPNNKEVASQNFSQNGYVILENISASDTLTYSIHFQNTGNDVAYNVVIMDTISSYLDLGTIQVIASSHPYIMTLVGRTVVFSFNNIMLPDSGTNQQASNGMIKFRIRQNPGNPQGTDIYNRGAIYFDINPPVITNQTQNSIPVEVFVPEISYASIKIYPNPFSDYTTIVISGNGSTANIKDKVKCVDVTGREIPLDISVQSAHSEQTVLRINRNRLADGIYFLRIDAGKLLTAKLVVSH
ncbi:MAG: T9SS type A sorting domain-containing protein [Bacteroidia bacterium]|nr:T9SS type A sorting domain-containing protein [Bacteroidia bacterium]